MPNNPVMAARFGVALFARYGWPIVAQSAGNLA
jgi:hypothetical protein